MSQSIVLTELGGVNATDGSKQKVLREKMLFQAEGVRSLFPVYLPEQETPHDNCVLTAVSEN